MGQRWGRVFACAFAAVTLSPAALASSGGMTLHSGNPDPNHGGGATCGACHSGGSFGGAAAIGGPASVSTNSTNGFSVDLTSSTAPASGFNLSVTAGQLASGSGSQLVVIGGGITDELTHTGPKAVAGGAASWSVSWTAPNATGSQTLYVCINQVVVDSDPTDDGPIRCTTKTVTVTNSAPTIAGFTNVATFTEGGAAAVVDGAITLNDVDNDNLNRAVMTLTNVQASDVLSCPGCAGAGLGASFSAGALTITGIATRATYASVLQGVTFSNASQNPNTTTRTVTLTVRDVFNNTSGTASTSLNVTAVNDAPTITAPGSIGVTEDQASPITGISFTDVDVGGGMLVATFTVGSGTLSAPSCAGVTTGGTTSAVTLTGTAANVNTCISGSNLTYTTALNSTTTVSMGVDINDQGNTGSGGAQQSSTSVNLIVAPVNHAPTLNTISDVVVNEDAGQQVVNLAGISAGPANENGQNIAISATSDTPSLIPNPTVTYTSPNATGSLSFTSAANGNGSATITVTVQDDGGTANGGADTLQRTFMITVNPVNDPPVVTAIPDQTVLDAHPFNYDVTVTDVDDSTFTYSLTNAPAWLTINPSGHIHGIPPIGTKQTFNVVVHAFDPSLAEGTTTLKLIVDAPDTDGDGIPDWFEALYPTVLDPNNPNDAALDPDRDGLTSLQEYFAGLDPTVDDVAPTLTVPADLVVPATGYYTVVDLGTATAVDFHDGPLTPTSTWTRPVVRPGSYDVIWSATDLAGNTATGTQHVDVLPRADFALDQTSGEGQVRQVTITLNGTSPGCPAVDPTVTYTVGGTAGAGDSDAIGGTLAIPCAGNAASIPVTITADGVTEPNETIVFTMTGATGATPGSQVTHTLTITDANAPPSVALTAFQGAFPRFTAYAGDGTFTVAANATDPNNDTLTYDWSGSDNALGIDATSGANATFDPSGVAAGNYVARVVVSDGNGGTASASALIGIAAGTSTLVDVDGDGIPEPLDTITGFAGVLPNEVGLPANTLLLETDPGYTLTLGRTALAAGRDGALIDMADLVTYGIGAGGLAYGADSYTNIGGLFDYEIHGVAPGGTVRVVLPLESTLRDGAIFRVFHPATGWTDFVSDAHDAIASASSSFGQCPSPSSTQYVAGLQPFADCLLVTVQDGGPNDVDGVADGVIREPSGAAQGNLPQTPIPTPGGGAFNAFCLLALGALRRRRSCHPERSEGSLSGSLVATLLGMTLALLSFSARADLEGTPRFSGELSSGYDTNVANAEEEGDIRKSGTIAGTVNAEYLLEPTLYTTVLLRGSLAAEQYQSFSKLSNQKATAMARYMIRPDGDFFSPVTGVWLSAAYWQFGSDLRDSYEYRGGLLMTQNLTTQIGGRLALSYAHRDSSSRVFDTHGVTASANLDWRPTSRFTIYGGYTYFRGDVVSTATTPGEFKIVHAADAIEPDDAFGGFTTRQFAYRLHAHSNIGTAGVNYPFSRRYSADVQAQYIGTQAVYDNHYTRWLGVLSLLARF